MNKWLILTALLLSSVAAQAEPGGWTPCDGSTVALTVTDSSGTTRGTLSATCGNTVLFSNQGTNAAFCDVKNSKTTATPTATTADTVVLPNSYKCIKYPAPGTGSDRKVACIAATGETATVYVETGTGTVD